MKEISVEKLSMIVKSKRETKGLRKNELSDLTGINRNILSRIEDNGHIPSIPQLNNLMKILGFSLDDIVDPIEESNVLVALMGQASTPEEREGFEKMVTRMLCLVKYKRLREVHHV